MPVRLIADASDLRSTFALYDPGALEDVAAESVDLKRAAALCQEGRVAIHHADEGNPSPDNPGTERRIAYLYVEEELSEEHRARSAQKVRSSRLRVPSGTLYFSSITAMRSDGPPEREGEAFAEASVPSGDYHLEIWLAEWEAGEQERFIQERTRPSDHTAEHRLGCLGFFTLAWTFVVPVALGIIYLLVPAVSDHVPSPLHWQLSLASLAVLWALLFGLSKAPSQKRLIAARKGIRAMALPAPIFRLTRREPGHEIAFVDEQEGLPP